MGEKTHQMYDPDRRRDSGLVWGERLERVIVKVDG
jgi:hypothetical protein